jgi:glycopeptide antibiotics resistance protein
MSYLISIKTAIIIFPFISLLFTVPFILHNYHKYGSINPFRTLIIYSFILYMITIYFLVILPLPNKSDVVKKADMVRLIPFGFIHDFIRETSFNLRNPSTYLKALMEPCFYTVAFNLLMTVPFGMYMRYYFKCNLKKTMILSFLLSLFFEITQVTGLYFIYPYAYRVFDVDDLIINTLGGIIGYKLFGILNNFLPTREEIDAHSIEAGKKVSGLRRTTLFIFDWFLFILIILFLRRMIKVKYLILITFVFYFIVYPYFKNGQTIGSRFLNVRLEFQKHRFINIVLRSIFLVLYYLGSAYMIFTIGLLIEMKFDLSANMYFFLFILSLFGILIFYLLNIFALLKDKKIYYDHFFHVEYISTIKKENHGNEN